MRGPRSKAGGASPSAMSVPVPSWQRPEGLIDLRLGTIVETLMLAGRRAALRSLVENVLVSVTVGLALFCALALANWVLGGLSPLLSLEWLALPAWLTDAAPSPIPYHLAAALFVSIATLLTLEILRYSRSRGIIGLAVAADRRFAAAERLSTALTLARRGSTGGVVGEALIQDALRWSQKVNEDELVPWRLPRTAMAIPGLVLLAVLLAWLPQAIGDDDSPAPANPSQVEAQAPEPEPERLALAEDIRAIAAIIAQDGRSRNDLEIQGIAGELNELGREVATNPELDAGAIANELERLRELAAGAYDRVGLDEEDAGNNARLIQNALNEVDQDADVMAGAEFGEDQQPAPPADDNAEIGGIGLQGGELPEGAPMVAPPGTEVDPQNLNNTDAPGIVQAEPIGAPPLANYDTPYDEDVPIDRPMPEEGELIGVGDGFEGDVAGLGAADLFGPDGEILVPGDTEGEFVLVDEDPADGRMIRLNLPPIAELMAVDGETLAEGDGWRQFDEQEVQRTTVPAEARAAVGRYFETLSAGEAE